MRDPNVKVFFRIYPTTKMEWNRVKILRDMKTVFVENSQSVGLVDMDSTYWKFETDGIFYNDTQSDIYNTVTQGLINQAVEGCNVIILMFGQTGSGKSLTASGLQNFFQDRGLAPRIITDLFMKKDYLSEAQRKMCIKMSYVETYTTAVYDLLNSGKHLDFRSLRDVTVQKVSNEYEALKLLFLAEGTRRFSQDGLRSHSANGILTFHIYTRETNMMNPVVTSAKIHIIDLAGIDLYDSKTALHKNKFDIKNANLIKSHIEKFITFLSQNISEYIKVGLKFNIFLAYLADSFNATSILRFVGHIRIDKDSLPVTLSTFKFGDSIRGLKSQKVLQNMVRETQVTDPILQAKLDELTKDQDLASMLKNEDLSTNLTVERIQHMENVVKDFLQDKTSTIVLLSVTDAKTILQILKHLYNELENETCTIVQSAYEKAYQDAMTTLKNSLETESLISVKTSKLKPPGDSTKVNTRGSSSAKYRQSDRASTGKQLKHTRTLSSIMKRSGTGKRKSLGSTTSTSTICNELFMEEHNLPDKMPDKEAAWGAFIVDDSYRYKKLNSLLSFLENAAQEIRNVYVREACALQKAVEVLEKCKDDSQKLEMQRLFQIPNFERSADSEKSYLEKLCDQNLKDAHAKLVEQQEAVLKAQTTFLVSLDECKGCKDQIREEYNLFCRNKYKIPVSNVDVPPIEEIEESIKVVSMDKLSDDMLSINSEDVRIFEKLKQLMEKQIERRIIKSKKPKRWMI